MAATAPSAFGGRHPGIIGLILLAKRTGIVPAVRPLLDDLTRQSFRIGSPLYESVLREAGE
jgi:predicted nucleic acid-binding protein